MPEIERACLENKYALMLVVNGPNPDSLTSTVLKQRKRLYREGFHKDQLITPRPQSFAKGAVGAAQKGYERFRRTHEFSTVVKLDTAEHPGSKIPTIVEHIHTNCDAVVADLDFSSEDYKLGENDQEADERIAGLCDALSMPFQLSHAHGFQGYAKGEHGEFNEQYKAALAIHQEAGRILKTPMKWGFDMAMILAAIATKRKVRQMWVPAMRDRVRPNAKVEDQLDKWFSVAGAMRNVRKSLQ